MIKTADVDFIAKKYHNTPLKLSDNCKDFINSCLSKDPNKRLGTKGDWKEVIKHPWLSDIDVDDLVNKRIKPMFIPKLSKRNIADISNFDEDFTAQEAVVSVVPIEM